MTKISEKAKEWIREHQDDLITTSFCSPSVYSFIEKVQSVDPGVKEIPPSSLKEIFKLCRVLGVGGEEKEAKCSWALSGLLGGRAHIRSLSPLPYPQGITGGGPFLHQLRRKYKKFTGEFVRAVLLYYVRMPQSGMGRVYRRKKLAELCGISVEELNAFLRGEPVELETFLPALMKINTQELLEDAVRRNFIYDPDPRLSRVDLSRDVVARELITYYLLVSMRPVNFIAAPERGGVEIAYPLAFMLGVPLYKIRRVAEEDSLVGVVEREVRRYKVLTTKLGYPLDHPKGRCCMLDDVSQTGATLENALKNMWDFGDVDVADVYVLAGSEYGMERVGRIAEEYFSDVRVEAIYTFR